MSSSDYFGGTWKKIKYVKINSKIIIILVRKDLTTGFRRIKWLRRKVQYGTAPNAECENNAYVPLLYRPSRETRRYKKIINNPS